MNKLEYICNKYIKYINDPNCVYKLCHQKWLIIMKKLPESITNENINENINSDSNENYIKYTTDKLYVLVICNVENIDTNLNKLIENYAYGNICYTVNEIIIFNNLCSNAFLPKNNILSNSIQYYKNIETAFYDRLCPNNYTGIWTSRYTNGQKISEGMYVNGMKQNYWIRWYSDGSKFAEGYYVDNKFSDRWIYWYDKTTSMMNYGINKEQKKIKGYYNNGMLTDHWTKWHSNGQIELDGEYIDGTAIGRWSFYQENGDVNLHNAQINKKRQGQWMYCYGDQIKKRKY